MIRRARQHPVAGCPLSRWQPYDGTVGPLSGPKSTGVIEAECSGGLPSAELQRLVGSETNLLLHQPGFGQQVEAAHAHHRVGAQANPDPRRKKGPQGCCTMPVRLVRQRAVSHGRAGVGQPLNVSRRDLDCVNTQSALGQHPMLIQPLDRCSAPGSRQLNAAREPGLGEGSCTGLHKLRLRG